MRIEEAFLLLTSNRQARAHRIAKSAEGEKEAREVGNERLSLP
jgi:hypothetical protein